MKIAPSILAADFGNLSSDLKHMEKAGADLFHIDIMDGQFVPNISFGIPVMESIAKITSLPKDVHLMIKHPEKYIEKFISLGADYVTIHPEATKSVTHCIDLIKSNGAKVGIALSPDTPFEFVIPYLKDIDLLLFMTVNPGFGGQKFIHEVLNKIAEADVYRVTNNLTNLLFEVDGGINETTADLCCRNHVDILVAGSYLFNSPNREQAIKNLRSIY